MNNYKDLALYDMRSVEANYAFKLWNKVGQMCQQVCEKYMKHYLQTRHLLPETLERTHNLRRLMQSIPGYDKALYKDLSLLSGYYFETNYPGDNFIELDAEMADEAIAIMNALVAYIDGLEGCTGP